MGNLRGLAGVDSATSPGQSDSELGESIISSLSLGVVAFDRDLKILHANSLAGQLLKIDDRLDTSLAWGTDSRVWGQWSHFLKAAIENDRGSSFKAVRYKGTCGELVLNISCTPLKDRRTNKVIGGAVLIEDVTQKVDAEYQLAEAERLAAIGKVAAKVAHELNNPMDGILRYINLACRVIEKGDSQKARDYLDHCRTGLMRMVHIVSELLSFSRGTNHAFEYASVERIVSDAVKTMESHRKEVDIKIVHDCRGTIPPVKVMSVFQIFCNLIKNALDAMNGAGRLTISIRSAEDRLFVEFQDTGCGFGPGELERVFDAFYTTKSNGKGTGLGLSICRDIIEKYGGGITAGNAEGGGAVVTVELPLTDEVVQRSQEV